MAGTTISKGFRLSTPRHHPESSWPTLAVVTILSIHLLVLMEWIFFVTKPSFLAVLDTGQRLVVLGLTPLPLLVLATGLLIPLALAARLLRKRRRAACWFGRVAKLVLGLHSGGPGHADGRQLLQHRSGLVPSAQRGVHSDRGGHSGPGRLRSGVPHSW